MSRRTCRLPYETVIDEKAGAKGVGIKNEPFAWRFRLHFYDLDDVRQPNIEGTETQTEIGRHNQQETQRKLNVLQAVGVSFEFVLFFSG